MPIAINRQTKEVELKSCPNGKVTFYTSLRWGAMNEYQNMTNENDKIVFIAFKLIKDWNLTDEKDVALPITLDSINELDVSVVMEIIGAGSNILAEQTEVKKKSE